MEKHCIWTIGILQTEFGQIGPTCEAPWPNKSSFFQFPILVCAKKSLECKEAGEVRAELSAAADKGRSVSQRLCGGKAGRRLSFPCMMGILQVRAVSEQR